MIFSESACQNIEIVLTILAKLDMNTELIRHFLIEPCAKGVKLKGSNSEPTFPSLVALVYQHSLTKMSLPCPLLIPKTGEFLVEIK